VSAALWREIPAVHELLARPAVAEWCARAGRDYVTARIREALDEVRGEIAAAPDEATARSLLDSLEARIAAGVRAGLEPSLEAVINASGVILHTNLGRAPLSLAAAQAAAEAAGAYTNLEYDLATGRRGKRDVHAATLLRHLLGAPAVVVNNNAAAVFLALHELAAGGEVIVSRGELVEIGGSFRIPDIMARSGATLREVGTTNRTRLADYERAVNERTRLLLRVHRSNFRIVGFTESPALEDLAALAKAKGLPLLEDLGSGCLVDLRPFGVADEPEVRASLRAGVDLVTFSGDKLLGGPQAGIIAGRGGLVARVRGNPLFRALRVDKLTYAALGATLRSWVTGRLDELPVVRMIRMTRAEIAARAREVQSACAARGVGLETREGVSVIGGGSTPGQSLPTLLLAVAGHAAEIDRQLRRHTPPVIARVEDEHVLFDLRTVLPGQDSVLAGAISEICGAPKTT
jgi:L-seryl-tRNA(Ser) seleniumtransferase